MNSNETEIVLSPDDGLEDNQKYTYTVSAINSFGMVTLNQNESRRYFCKNHPAFMLFACIPCSPNPATLDVQAVNATVIGESTIDVQCLFIRGSDAVGCKIIFLSECQGVADKNVEIIRNDTSNIGRLSLTSYNISCYLKVLAYDIDVNNTISNVSIDARIRPMEDNKSPGKSSLSFTIRKAK